MPEDDEKHEFTEEETKILNSLPIIRASDSSFVRILLQFLYKDNLSDLKTRSYSGKSRGQSRGQAELETEATFKAITPAKKRAIHYHFSNRINKSNIPIEEKVERLDAKYISKLVSWGIGTLRKTLPKNEA